jgi:hypothetical protein
MIYDLRFTISTRPPRVDGRIRMGKAVGLRRPAHSELLVEHPAPDAQQSASLAERVDAVFASFGALPERSGAGFLCRELLTERSGTVSLYRKPQSECSGSVQLHRFPQSERSGADNLCSYPPPNRSGTFSLHRKPPPERSESSYLYSSTLTERRGATFQPTKTALAQSRAISPYLHSKSGVPRAAMLLLQLAISILASGCVSQVASHRGRVLESSTHKPVSGATVEIVGCPETRTRTDKRGEFRTNMGTLRYFGRKPRAADVSIRVKASKYYPVTLTWPGSDQWVPVSKDLTMNVGDICLRPAANAIDALLFGGAPTSTGRLSGRLPAGASAIDALLFGDAKSVEKAKKYIFGSDYKNSLQRRGLSSRSMDERRAPAKSEIRNPKSEIR